MKNLKSVELDIDGMSCPACAASIQNALRRRDYIDSAEVFLLTNSAKINYDADVATEVDILNLVHKVGYKAKVSESFTEKMNEAVNLQKPKRKLDSACSAFEWIETRLLTQNVRTFASFALMLMVLCMSMLADMLGSWKMVMDSRINGMCQLVITLVVMHMGRDIYLKGVMSLFRLSPDANSLITLGTLSGFSYSSYFVVFNSKMNLSDIYFESICTTIAFTLMGRLIEHNARNKALSNANALLSKVKQDVIRVENDIETEIDLTDIRVGDVIKVLPNSLVPADGIVQSKHAMLDESGITGENIPVNKEKGDRVYSGTINTNNPFTFVVTREVEDSTMASIEKLIKGAINSKAGIASVADNITAYFVPFIIALALCAGGFWLLAGDLRQAMLHFSSTVLISCPCALGLATPMSILFANAKSNKLGIFFKNSQSIENTNKIRNVFFDKTGTLTTGALKVREVTSFSKLKGEHILSIAKSLESNSEHVIAKTLRNVDAMRLNVLEQEGSSNLGVSGRVKLDKDMSALLCSDEAIFSVGDIRMFDMSMDKDAAENEGIVVAVGVEGEVFGIITLEDQIRDDAKNAIDKLKNMGLQIKILSGDKERNVKRIADLLGVKYRAHCSPEDKLLEIKSVGVGHAIMVGDGSNDAGAMAGAAVSICIGKPSALSVQSSDVLVTNGKISSVVDALKIGRKTLRNIKQNLAFAFVYNVICIPVAMGVFGAWGVGLNPTLASIAMSLSSTSIVLNASRIYYSKV